MPDSFEPHSHAVFVEIDDVGRTAAVEITQPDPGRIELVLRREERHAVHRDAPTEASAAEIRPVVHAAALDPHDVLKTVAGHVGKKDPSRGVVERDRGTCSLVAGFRQVHGPAIAAQTERTDPHEVMRFRDQQVGQTIAVDVDLPQPRVRERHRRLLRESDEGRPIARSLARVIALTRDGELELSVTVDVHELCISAQSSDRRLRRKCLLAAEASATFRSKVAQRVA